ncbi:MAG: valine--tRNA ligase [Christensenellaceae bacterium]|jgi:valyl-tRNA synthetase
MKQENNIAKAYDPKLVEDKLYARWLERKYFAAFPNKDKQPYTIMMPPPNITGQLHIGHGLDNTMQDIIIRFKRMQGYEALWMPGTDHASIATEVKIVDEMRVEGLTKEDVGREGFLKRAWKWKDEYGGRIVEQLKKLGTSCDWDRERFTMDEGCTEAVLEVFLRLYEKGLIYKGDRIINWCPVCGTAISDAEVDYEEKASHLWHIRYDAEDGNGSVVVATTRPETMLGDTAVAVNPKDERYQDLIGKNVILPLMNRPIPVVADEYVDMEFGTGAVKITPAHDPNDFEVATRHDLPMIRIMNDEAIINELGGAYEGMDRYAAREKIVADLKALGQLVKIEEYAHNVGSCYRCHTVIEPIISKQWFVSMKPLAEPAIEAVKSGKIQFVPERYAKTYLNWMENIRDWCISRQLWWGHRIPAYYCDACGEMVVAKEMPEQCACGCGSFHQDEDVLDTWFSSGLWPFSTLGWPEKTPELDYFYPTNVLVTAYDIIFFWVARMIFFGLEVMGEIPFAYVNMHGIVRDEQGRKMSKSLGNGVDPLEVIDAYGADAFRFSLTTGTSPGNDMRFSDTKVKAAGNFANKIWNASRFVAMNLEGEEIEQDIDQLALDIADKWILTRLSKVTAEVTENLEKFELGLAAGKIYDFIWSEYCDWYIEMCKARLYDGTAAEKKTALSVLVYVLERALKLLHPFMPFITEEVYVELLSAGESIVVSPWPEVKAAHTFTEEEAALEGVMELTRSVRNLRAERNVPPSKRTKLYVMTDAKETIMAAEEYLKRLAYATEVEILPPNAAEPKNTISAVTTAGSVYLPLGELVDIAKELERLAKEKENLLGEVKRAEGKLNNARFLEKAPAQVVEEEKKKLQKYQEMLGAMESRMEAMQALQEEGQ